MRRLPLVLILFVTLAAPVAVAESAGGAVRATNGSSVHLLAFRGHFGGFSLGGGRYGRSRFGSAAFGRRGAGRGLLRRVVHALAFAYILHLLFSHGGISLLIWLIVIGLLIHVFRRRRRNRYAY
jgi:hypothetical protein